MGTRRADTKSTFAHVAKADVPNDSLAFCEPRSQEVTTPVSRTTIAGARHRREHDFRPKREQASRKSAWSRAVGAAASTCPHLPFLVEPFHVGNVRRAVILSKFFGAPINSINPLSLGNPKFVALRDGQLRDLLPGIRGLASLQRGKPRHVSIFLFALTALPSQPGHSEWKVRQRQAPHLPPALGCRTLLARHIACGLPAAKLRDASSPLGVASYILSSRRRRGAV